MTISVIKNIFNAGEFSPKVWPRVDLDKWPGGCETMLNVLPLPQGGFVRRPGFKIIAPAKNNNQAVRLIDNIFSSTQAYILEFGPSYLRFYKNKAQIWDIDSDTDVLLHFNGIDNSTDFVDETARFTPVAVGNAKIKTAIKKFGSAACSFDGVNSYVRLADSASWNMGDVNFTVDCWVYIEGNVDANPTGGHGIWSQWVDDNNYYGLGYDLSSPTKLWFELVETGTTRVSLSATWTPEKNRWYHIALIRGWSGNANDWAICVDGTAIVTDTAAYTVPDFAGYFYIGWNVRGEYLEGRIDEFRVSQWSARWTANFNPPQSEYPYGDDSGTVYEIATNYNESDLADLQYTQSYDTMYITHQNHTPRKLLRYGHNNWNLSDVSFTGAPTEWSNNNGWPRACAFYQDRLVFGGSTKYPSRLWFSQTSNYTVMTTGVNDSDGMTLNLLSGTSDTIYWIASGKTLICGTDTGIQSISAANGSNAALTPTNKLNAKQSYFGTSEVQPIKLGDLIIHAGNPASKIRELFYSWEKDGFNSTELTVLSDHLLDGYTVREFAYQQTPNEIVWCRRSDGALLALTYMQEQRVVAWSRHSSGNIVSLATIPGDTETELWAAINRNVNNSVVTTIELLSSFKETAFNDSYFLDSGIYYNSSNTTTVEGLDHLEGETVTYFANQTIDTAVVANNNLVLNNNLNTSPISVGLPYTSEFKTLPVEVELKDKASMFSTKRITEISVRCRNSAGGQYGPNNNNLTNLFANNSFTDGVVDNLSMRGGYQPARAVIIKTSDPLPINIDAIGMEVEI